MYLDPENVNLIAIESCFVLTDKILYAKYSVMSFPGPPGSFSTGRSARAGDVRSAREHISTRACGAVIAFKTVQTSQMEFVRH